MKILIGSLLFATAIVINFSELNSSPQPSGAGPSHGNVEGRNTKRTYITLFGKQIEIDLERIGNRFEAVDCRVLNPESNIPSRHGRADINFMTQADFKRVGRNFIQIVIYVREDAQKIRKLLGAKLPPTGHEEYYPDDPHNLNPDITKWFITYESVDYEVEVDPVLQNVVDIKLRNRTNKRPSYERIIASWHKYEYIHFGGIYFLVFRGAYKRIVGVALDPYWMHRPGEEFANVNPHDDPQTHPQINLRIEQNPEPQQNLEQQHHLGHHQNLNPYQNLHQNPYSYDHQTFDPNQHHAHQAGFQIPHFDPTQHYPQQGDIQTPHFGQHYPQQGDFQNPDFDPNQNWHYQPHPPPNH